MPASKTIVITGAASGLGKAWAKGFMADGAKVVATDINAEGLEELKALGAITLVCDVTNETDVKNSIETALSETGRLDVMFNNAGIGINRPFLEIPEDEFEKQIRIHLFGMVYGMRYALPVMLKQDYGRIVNTISRGAEFAAAKNGAYAAAKAGMWAATRSVCEEIQNKNILINMLIPGPTNTGIWGKDMPQMQSPDVTYPTAKMLATLPSGGPHGDVYWDEKPYPIFKYLYD